jgi:uncharacterized protein (TIGR03435 family)
VLTVAKNGPKLTVVTKPGDRQGMSAGRGANQGFAASMSMLATNLAGTLGRPVVDKTGLKGKWTPVAGPRDRRVRMRPNP